MRMKYRGNYDQSAAYRRGDVVRMGSGYQVFGLHGFAPTTCPLDESCIGPAGLDGIDGRDSKIPGPKGRDGIDGKHGRDGANGRSFNPRGKYRVGETYHALDVVTFDGSSWIATTETMRRPGRSPDWQLLAARGDTGGSGTIRVESQTVGGSDFTPEAAIFDSDSLAGFAVYVPTDGHVDNARANNYDTSGVVGLCLADVGASAAGQYVTEGTFSLEDWSAVTGSANLSPGAVYYLSTDVAGRLTITPPESPSTNVVAVIGRALNYRTLDISIGLLLQLEAEEET